MEWQLIHNHSVTAFSFNTCDFLAEANLCFNEILMQSRSLYVQDTCEFNKTWQVLPDRTFPFPSPAHARSGKILSDSQE